MSSCEKKQQQQNKYPPDQVTSTSMWGKQNDTGFMLNLGARKPQIANRRENALVKGNTIWGKQP